MADESINVWSKSDVVYTYQNKHKLFKAEQRLLHRYFSKGMRVLDLGCGTGRVAAAIAKDVDYIKGIDISAEMVEAFRRNFPQFDCECRPMDGLDESGVSYDMAIIPYNSLDYVRPKDKRLQTLERVHNALKSGGVLIFSSHNPLGSFGVWLYSRHPGVWIRSAGRILKGEVFKNEGYFPNYIFGSSVSHYFGSPKQVIRDLEKVGYAYLEQCGGNLGMGSVRFNRLFETWIYYAFRKHDE